MGLLHPIVVTTDHRLVAGRRRLAAAKELGWVDIPVHVVHGLDDVLHRLRLAINRFVRSSLLYRIPAIEDSRVPPDHYAWLPCCSSTPSV
ncbi:MAG: ParB N-terminal domain-containing protein [Gemmataceae bacterium]